MTETTGWGLDRVARHIYVVRGRRIMLDDHLAGLYGVPVKRLNEQVRRNARRFPLDFMFQLSNEEFSALRSQFATLDKGRGRHRKYLPLAFTEQGVAMLSSVLNSARAVEANITIMRAFVHLRELALTHADLVRRLTALERKYDARFRRVFDAIRELMSPPEGPRRRIAFRP